MTIPELERELIAVKSTLQQLQIAVDRMSTMLEAQSKPHTSVKWLALIGVGKEIWQGIDPDEYLNAERNSWN